jgi:biofilm PGA synthesis N-glycosyltransferase PgaC
MNAGALIPEVAELIREIDAIKYIFYAIWALPIFRIYKVFKDGMLSREALKDLPKRKVKIAVVIPARNASKYISDVIKSILRQTFKPVLVVIIDDASEDNTFTRATETLRALGGKLLHISLKENKVIEEVYALQGIKFVIKRNLTHLGKAKSLNTLKDLLKDYDYVMTLDADTIIEDDFIERLLESMGSDKSSGAASGLPLLWKSLPESRLAMWIAKAFRETSFLFYALSVKVAESRLGAVATLSGCCMLIKRSALDDIGGFPENTLADDAELSLRLSAKGYRLHFVPEAIAYTVDPGNPLLLSRKLFRVLRGMYTSFLRVLPEILKRRRWGLLVTAIYNIFGGIPFSLSLMNLFATMVLALKGYLDSSFLLYLASLLQFSMVSFILNVIAKYPLTLLALSYLWGAVGSFLSLVFILKIYESNTKITKITLNAMKYSFLVPLVLWLQALITIPAVLGAIKDLIKGVESKW